MVTNKIKILVVSLSCIIILSSSNNIFSANLIVLSGRVVKIVDGDTYDVLLDGKQTRIRMEGIDAPEKGMDFYKTSKRYLNDLCIGKIIQIKVSSKDRYGRTIAKSFLPDKRELGMEMIRAGMAWHFKKYSKNLELDKMERLARDKKIGIWSMSKQIPPWEYRKRRKK